MATDVKVPEVGESITEAYVLQWLVPVGAMVEVDQEIVELETDKVTVNVPSPVAGKLVAHLAEVDDTVAIGQAIAQIDESASASDAAPAPEKPQEEAKAAAPAAPAASAASAAPAAPPQEKAREQAAKPLAMNPEIPLMPAVRRLLAENNLSPEAVIGTGPGGRILKEDVLNHLAGKSPARQTQALTTSQVPAASAPALSESEQGPEEVVRMSRLRQAIAKNLVEAQQTAAILTTFNEVDMTEVMALRNRYKDAFQKKYGIKLGFMGFFAKATVEALKAFPAVNAEMRDNAVAYKHYYHIGVAVGGGRGLVVPVVRNVDQIGFADFEVELADLAVKARDNKLSMAELTGGTFTISNGGVYGSLLSTPILNPPQVGILGLHKIEQRPVAVNGQVEIRPMMYLALSYDHRVIDGREAVSFLVRIKECLEDPSRILLEI